jgi:SAM-dependent methyltransferase
MGHARDGSDLICANSSMTSESVCILCGCSQSREVFRFPRPDQAEATGRHTEALFGRVGRIVRCRECSLVRQLEPSSAPYEEMEDLEYIAEEVGIRRTVVGILETVERYRPPGSMLDVGAGPGFMVEEAQARGWTATGVEPSAWAIGEAKNRGVQMIHGTLETVALTPAAFDVIVATDVIEHVANPILFATRIHELLTPDGIVFLATPNVTSLAARVLRRLWWSVIPNHLWYFSPQTLGRLMEMTGFVPVWIGTHPKTFSVEYYAGRLGGYNDRMGKIARALSQLAGPARLVTPNFHDRIGLVARKRP